MSICKLKDALVRIDAATPDSPVVVQKLSASALREHPRCVEVSFHNTVLGRQIADTNNIMLVGVFHNAMSRSAVEARIYDAIHDGRSSFSSK